MGCSESLESRFFPENNQAHFLVKEVLIHKISTPGGTIYNHKKVRKFKVPALQPISKSSLMMRRNIKNEKDVKTSSLSSISTDLG